MKKLIPCIFIIFLFVFLNGCSDPSDSIEPPLGTRNFWVNDMVLNTWTQENAKLVYYNDKCAVYVRSQNVDPADQANYEFYGNYFESHSWVDICKHVQIPVEYFEENGNRINLFFYPMLNNIAGYFWSKDFFSDSFTWENSQIHSNETNVLYLNLAYINDNLFTQGTVTHEFQHLCNAQYFLFGDGQYKEREMDSWANEFCSTLMESVFADQYAIYVPSFNLDLDCNNDTKPDFSSGQTDFLFWTNSYTQYITASLFGGFIMSQIPYENRPAFIKTFLDNTFAEDPTPYSYSTSIPGGTDIRTSVEDLLATLQNDKVNFDAGNAGTGWVDVSSFSDTAVATDWAILFKGFLSALTGNNPDFSARIYERGYNRSNSRVFSADSFSRTFLETPVSRTTSIPGAGDATNGSDGTLTGNLYCVYVAR